MNSAHIWAEGVMTSSDILKSYENFCNIEKYIKIVILFFLFGLPLWLLLKTFP